MPIDIKKDSQLTNSLHMNGDYSVLFAFFFHQMVYVSLICMLGLCTYYKN